LAVLVRTSLRFGQKKGINFADFGIKWVIWFLHFSLEIAMSLLEEAILPNENHMNIAFNIDLN